MSNEVFFLNLDGNTYNFYFDPEINLKVMQVGLGEIRLRGMSRYDKALPDLKDRIIEVFNDSQFSILDGKLMVEIGYKGRQNISSRREFAYFYLNNPMFTHLDFYSDPLTAESEILALRQSLNGNTSLTDLNFYKSKISIADPQTLYEIFKALVCIKVVKLDGQNLNEAQIEGVVRGLLQNQCIKDLDLGINDLNELGMAAVKELLESSKTIEKLHLYMMSLSTEAVSELAEGIRKNQSLRYIDLDECLIGSEGGKILAEALKENQYLSLMDLPDTRIGTDGAGALGQMLKVNTSLTGLNLSFNGFDDDATQVVT